MNDEEDSPRMQAMTIGPTPGLDDVTGTARQFLDDIILNIESEGIYAAMGVQPSKTYGLFGVPGTGKTMAVQALNNHMNESVYLQAMSGKTEGLSMEDYNLCVFEYSIGRFGTAYINRGSRIVQTFFDNAGILAQYGKKVLIVMDEADALLASRTGGVRGHAEDRKILETIMKNMQHVHDTCNMYAVLMSNLPEACDDAALRAGRIDKKYTFKLPNEEERAKAFQLAIDGANARANYKVVRGVRIGDLVPLSAGFNYADIIQSVDEAVRGRATEVARDKTPGIMPAAYVTQKRVREAVEQHKQDFIKDKHEIRIGFK